MKHFGFTKSFDSADRNYGTAYSSCANDKLSAAMAISAIAVVLLSAIRLIIRIIIRRVEVIGKSEYGWLNLQRA